MSEIMRTPEEVARLEKSRQATDEKLKQGGAKFDQFILDENGRLVVTNNQLEILRSEMERELAADAGAPIIKEKISQINEGAKDKRFKEFEKTFVKYNQSTLPVRLSNAVFERDKKQFDQLAFDSGLTLTFSEGHDRLRQNKPENYVDKISNDSSEKEINDAHREIFDKVSQLLYSVGSNLKENLWSSPVNNVRLKEIFADIEHVRNIKAEFEPFSKTGVELLKEILLDLAAGLKFDAEYNPEAVHVMGIFTPAIENVNEALDLISEFQAKILASEMEKRK